MKVIFAKTAGFCYGVERAVKMAEQESVNGPCSTLGPLIHNDQVVQELKRRGVSQVKNAEDAKKGETIIIRSHGVTEREMDILREKDCIIVDATCPNVSRIHKLVRKANEKGRMPVVIGSAEHPEVVAICGWCEGASVFKDANDLATWLSENPDNKNIPISVVCQTTETRANMEVCNNLIKKECTNYEVFDTICEATSKRQQEAAKLSEICDAMVVIGGRSSANTRRLAEICAEICPQVFFAETAEELDIKSLKKYRKVGITAGASTPAWIIKEVYNKMTEEIKDLEVIAGEAEGKTEEASFAELLEQSIKTLSTGEKVTGVVEGVSPTEISVDLGTKHSAYIPVSEFSDDPDVKIEDIKIGSEIEAFVVRVNDIEGTIMLSKKRLDAVKNWESIDEAREARVTLSGIVTEENKGGIVVTVKGVRVFVPASESGLPKETPMTELLKKRVSLRIKEVNRSRRRVVGSIKAALQDERRAASDKIWETLEVGAKFDGVVKSLTSYGVFVDIGGIDGMVHVSELSWKRTKNPADLVKVGDKITVYVLSFDKEKRKISLTCKNKGENPWEVFTKAYEVGSVAKVRIVKLMDFGAFAEIVPGVDGLIHISQIADRRIAKTSDALSEGQEVDAKIIEIDNEKKKVSLSIRAILGKENLPENTESDDIVYSTEAPAAQ